MNNYKHTICILIPLMWIKGLMALDGSLNLPKFDEIMHSNDTREQEKLIQSSDEIVVHFEKEKGVPKFSTSDQVSVDFVNEEIKSVLRYIAELYDLNIIIPTSLTGNVTLRLKNVDWKDLLTAVLAPLGCSYSDHNGIIQIASESMVRQEPLQTKTFILKFADAKKVAEELKDFVNKEAQEKIFCNDRTNILVWTGRAKNLSMIEEIIEKLDKPETQVMIEAKFVEASNNVADARGFKWPSGLSIYYQDEGAGSTTTTTTTEDGTTTTTSDDKHGQIEYGLMGNKFFRGSSLFIQTLQGAFDFQQTDSFGKTLSNPTIITMNNVPAAMNVTTNYPVPKYSYNSDNKTYEISGFEEKPIGIELKVTPKVQSKHITLKIEPSLSEQTGAVSFSGGSGIAISYPQIKEKKTSSMVTIESGRAIAIGGLMSESTRNDHTKTPFLGDIPLLGNIFRHKSKIKDMSNLIIFLSATQIAYDGTIVYPTQVGVKNVSDKKLFEMGLSDKDMPGESELSDKEKVLYAELRTLQAKLDSIEMQKKADKERAKLTQSLQKATKPKKKPSEGNGRASRLHKKQQTMKTVQASN